MKLEKAKVEIIKPAGYDLESIKKHIEICGRTCYKSEGNITDDSYEKFINMLIKSGHTSVLEHGTLYFKIPYNEFISDIENSFDNIYTKIFYIHNYYYVTTNFRALIENKYCISLDLLEKYLCAPTEYHDVRITVRFNTQIAISREFNRHRVNSVSEQSTRYCNFSKDKFNKEISINLPSDITEKDIDSADMKQCYGLMESKPTKIDQYGKEEFCQVIFEREVYSWKAIDWWLWANRCAELAYMKLIECGWKPQQARTILPLDTSTELVHTAYIDDWMHFLKLRSPKYGANGVHPDAAILADKLYNLLLDNKYISGIKTI